jgi:hypothetical protein
MAWQLIGEVLDHCPDLRYREFRVLVALAFEARPETRQCRPGLADIARVANCGERTVRTALAGLKRQGLITTAGPSAPGRRAAYEILPMPGTEAGMSAHVTEAGMSAHVTEADIPARDSPERGPILPATQADMSAHSTKVPTEPIYGDSSVALTGTVVGNRAGIGGRRHPAPFRPGRPPPPPEVAHEGAAAARKAMAQAADDHRSGPASEGHWVDPVTEAARQVAEARQRRGELPARPEQSPGGDLPDEMPF